MLSLFYGSARWVPCRSVCKDYRTALDCNETYINAKRAIEKPIFYDKQLFPSKLSSLTILLRKHS